MQGTVADEQRLPQQLTFARLALLLAVAIVGSLECGSDVLVRFPELCKGRLEIVHIKR